MSSMVHNIWVSGFIEECLDQAEDGITSEEIIEHAYEQFMEESEMPGLVKTELHDNDTFGARLVAQEYLGNFRHLANDMGLSLSEMRDELDKNREEIHDDANLQAVRLIEDWISEFQACPICSNDLFLDEQRDVKYCPVCD